jgi:hypothetical protein
MAEVGGHSIMSDIKIFSEQEARELVGTSVVKRVLCEMNPAVKPGQIGKVVQVFEASLAEGFGVVVDWGNGEKWWYETPDSFEEDTEPTKVLSFRHPNGE